MKQIVEDLRYIEQTGLCNHLSSYEAGVIADLIEEQDSTIRDLMFENESKQNRINQLQSKLEQMKRKGS